MPSVLFAALDTTYFRPHPMTPAVAKAIAEYIGRDVYLIGWLGKAPVAYGMLRGWDEGYEAPSLRVAVRSGYWDRGLGRDDARVTPRGLGPRGRRVRLRFAPGNSRARHRYATLGYRHLGTERDELLYVLDLHPKPTARLASASARA